MNAAQKDAIARIKFLAADKRQRVMWPDQCSWLEEKMTEIVKLSKAFPVRAWKPKKEKQP